MILVVCCAGFCCPVFSKYESLEEDCGSSLKSQSQINLICFNGSLYIQLCQTSFYFALHLTQGTRTQPEKTLRVELANGIELLCPVVGKDKFPTPFTSEYLLIYFMFHSFCSKMPLVVCELLAKKPAVVV